jgi:hypothetical protein
LDFALFYCPGFPLGHATAFQYFTRSFTIEIQLFFRIVEIHQRLSYIWFRSSTKRLFVCATGSRCLSSLAQRRLMRESAVVGGK